MISGICVPAAICLMMATPYTPAAAFASPTRPLDTGRAGIFARACSASIASAAQAAASPADSIPVAGRGGVTGPPADTIPDTRSARVDSLEANMSRRRLTRILSDYIFAKPAGEGAAKPKAERSELPYTEYQGRYIRSISVLRLNVFGESAVGTTGADEGKLAKLLNALHIDTREGRIKDFFLMRVGKAVDPYEIADTERILRQTRFIQDARIEFLPVPESPDSVDLVVVTRDVWSLGASGKVITADRFLLKIYDRNVFGSGHDFENEFDIDMNRERPIDYTGNYIADNMQGSFIRSNLQYVDSHAEITTRIDFRRSLIAPQINYIGGLTLRWTETKPLRADEERTRYNLQDGWFGRAFSLGRNPAGGPGRTKLTLSGRVARTDYELRPVVRADTNRSCHDRTLILGSLTLSRNDYRTSRLIYSYGTTEDIPVGYLAAVTAGVELNEFEHLPYLGVDLYGGNYWEGFGFLNTRLRVGSYIRNDRFENTAVDLFQGYFTDLVEVGNCYLRQFIRTSYTAGYRRFEDDRVELDRFNGVYGLGDTGRRGKQRLVLYYEPLLFTPLDLFTFRLAFFAFASAGTVADDLDRLFTSRYYTSLGVGFRFHSERLVFDAMEFRLIFYPSIPEGSDPDWHDYGTVPTLRMPGFSPGKPSTVGYK